MLAFDDAQAAVARPDTATPLSIASRPDSAPLLVLTASPRKAAAPVEPAAPPSIGPASASPRFQVEAAVFVSDRQPSRASRLASATQSGVITQTGPTQITGPITPPPPPAFPTPVAGDPATGVFVANGVSALREGSIANVRGWSSGLDLGVRSPRTVWTTRGGFSAWACRPRPPRPRARPPRRPTPMKAWGRPP